MASEEHQRLVNMLARALEDQKGVQIVAVDIADTPHCFDQKYRNLSRPTERKGRIPDLEGMDAAGVRHLGEAETYMEAENLNEQLETFSNRVMHDTKAPIPLHVIVPSHIWSQMVSRIRNLGLGDKLDNGRITVWHA